MKLAIKVQLREQLSKPVGQSIPQANGSPHEAKASYRFFGNDRVKHTSLIEELRQETLGRIAPGEVVLLVQDTTSIDFNGRAGTAGLGTLESQHSRGLFVHTTLAVSGNG